jgi:hypothetical protein
MQKICSRQRHYDSIECLFLYKRLVALQEHFEALRNADPLVRSIEVELTSMHTFARSLPKRMEAYLDFGLRP